MQCMAEKLESGGRETLLRDVIPPGRRIWWHYPGLRSLNFLLLCALLTKLTNGYDGSIINGLQILPEWREFFGSPKGARLGSIVNGVRYGQITGLFVAAPLLQKFGRRRPIIWGSSILLCGVVLQAAAQNYGMFVTGRVLIGFGNTIQTTACPILISELAYPAQRTHMVGVMHSTGSCGQALAAWITFGTATAALAGSSWTWRLPSALQVVSSLSQAIIAIFVPESPRWLVQNGFREEAENILLKYHAEGEKGSPLLNFELAEIERSVEAEKASTSWLDWFGTRANCHRLWIVVTAGFIIQWCGNAVISAYLHLVLESIGITNKRTQLLVNGGLGLNGFLWGNIFAQFVDRIGRRYLFLIGLTGMFFSLLTITTLSSLQSNQPTSANGNKSGSALANGVVASIFIFGVFYKMPAPMTNTYIAEVAPFNLRAKAFVIFGFAENLANVFSGYVNPIGLTAIGWKYWIVWCFVLVSNFVVVYFTYPETRHLSLDEAARKFELPGLGRAKVRSHERNPRDKQDTAVKITL